MKKQDTSQMIAAAASPQCTLADGHWTLRRAAFILPFSSCRHPALIS